MLSPSKMFSCRRAHSPSGALILIVLAIFPVSIASCGGNLVKETSAETKAPAAPALPPASIPTWLGNYSRNFYGTGPWADAPSEILWEFETKLSKGRMHKDPWGGSSWPGQPSLDAERVYFGSADSYLYCLNRKDGSLIW